MNIDEYRAMKAEEAQEPQEQQQMDSQREEQPDAQAQHTPVADTETIVHEQEEGDNTSQESGTEETAQSTQGEAETTYVEVNGQQVPIDELRDGYLRQSDYTRKTQELARDREKTQIAERYYEAATKDPELAQRLATENDIPYMTPEDARVKDLETKYYDLQLQQEVSTLQAKYPDFDPKEIVKTAYTKGISNLEDVYLMTKGASAQQQTAPKELDVTALTEQIRQQVLAELESTVDTSSIITSSGGQTQVKDEQPNLSSQQLRVAKGMGLSPAEYSKWQNKK